MLRWSHLTDQEGQFSTFLLVFGQHSSPYTASHPVLASLFCLPWVPIFPSRSDYLTYPYDQRVSSTGPACSSHSTCHCSGFWHLALHGQLPHILSWVRVSQNLPTSGPVQWASLQPPGSRTNLEQCQHPGLQHHVPLRRSKALREDLSQVLTPRA